MDPLDLLLPKLLGEALDRLLPNSPTLLLFPNIIGNLDL